MRQVGHGQQQRLQLGLDLLEPRRGAVQIGLQRGHLRHDLVDRFALGLALADLLGELVALRLQLFGAGLDGFALGFQRA